MSEESEIKKAIMGYLERLPGCYARVIQVKGIKGRTSPSKGVLDIIAAYKGRAIAIEVKTPSGRLEESQKEFIEGWTRRGGGVALVARSLDDVINYFCGSETT